jgi:hypothetical protein
MHMPSCQSANAITATAAIPISTPIYAIAFPSLITVSVVCVEVGAEVTVFAVIAVTAFVATTVLVVAGDDALTVMLRPAQKDLPHSRATRYLCVSRAQNICTTER